MSEGNIPHGESELSATEAFLGKLTTEVKKEDVLLMVEAQDHMLGRFEKTNEMLLNFNVLARARYETTCQEFKRHTMLLGEMKRDLDSVFLRIRDLKETLAKKYPTAFTACGDVYNLLQEEEEEEDEQCQSSTTEQDSCVNNSKADLQTKQLATEEKAPSEGVTASKSSTRTSEPIPNASQSNPQHQSSHNDNAL